MAISSAEFQSRLAESGLMTDEGVRAFLSSFPAGKAPADGEQLARELVKARKLTAYQAQAIYKGKGRSLVLGNYVVLDKLGQGGMGMVLKAEHQRMQRVVALKVLSPDVVKTPELLERFQREVRAAARLNHQNIVAAYDADEAAGTHYLVMEYVEGTDLSAFVKKRGPLPVPKAVECIVQAGRGLQYAHEHGVIHRDIKPANLLLGQSGTVKILDMGLARIESADGPQTELTSTGAVMGTIDYMAPEQALSTKDADARSDIYSLGISLWYLLTGRAAYQGDSLMARLLAHREAPIPSLCAMRQDVPKSVDAVFQKMVAKKPEDRYQTMALAVADLERCLGGESSTPSLNGGPSEDSKLDAFLGVLSVEGLPGPSATATTRQGVVAEVDSVSRTMLTGDVSEATDPQTRTSAGSKMRSRSHARASKLPTGPAAWGSIAGVFLLMTLGGIWLFSAKSPTTTGNSHSQPVSATSANDGHRHSLFDIQEWLVKQGAVLEVFTADGGRHLLDQYTRDRPLEPTHIDVIDFAIAALSTSDDQGRLAALPGPMLVRMPDVTPLTDVELAGLLQRMPGAERVHLRGNQPVFTKQFVEALRNHPLRFLHVSSREIELGSLLALSQLPNLIGFGLEDDCTVTPKVLSELNRVGGLKHVSLNSPAITDAHLAALRLPDDILLTLSGTSVSLSAVNAFRSRFPGINVEFVPGYFTPEETTGQTIAGLAFPGGEGHVSLPLRLSRNTPITVEAWVTPSQSALDQVSRRIWHAGGIELKQFGRNWDLIGPGRGGVELQDRMVSSHGGAIPGERTHLAAILTRAGLTLFVDGKLAQRREYDALPDTPQPMFLGSGAQSSGPTSGYQSFAGTIHEVRISNGDRYRLDNFVPPETFESDPATLALYRMTEGSGDILKDLSEKGHDGTIVGGNWVGDANVADGTASANTTDLLALVDPQRDPLVFNDGRNVWEPGGWTQAPSGWCSGHARRQVLRFPYSPTAASYTLAVDAELIDGRGGLWIVVAAGSRFCFFSYNGFNDGTNASAGFGHIDGKAENQNETTVPHPATPQGATAKLEIDVDLSGVNATLAARVDGRELTRFSGFQRRLSIPSFENFADGSSVSIAVGTTSSQYLIRRAELTEFPQGRPAAENWQELFNGRDLAGWTTYGQGTWKVDNGILIAPERERGQLGTNDDYDDFELELDYRMTAEGNSGIFLRIPSQETISGNDFLELQLLDDNAQKYAAVPSNARNLSLWKQAAPLRPVPPTVGAWHRLHLRAIGPDIQVRQDGEVVLETSLTGEMAKHTSGRIGLQSLEGAVAFRNIRIRRLGKNSLQTTTASLPSTSSNPSATSGNRYASDEWIDVLPLIDPALDKWDLPNLTGKNAWRVEGGRLVVDTRDGKPAKLLLPLDVQGKSFELEVEFTRLAGDGGFDLDVPAAKGPLPVIYDHFVKGKSLLGDQRIPSTGPCVIRTGDRQSTRILVRHTSGRDSVEMSFDGTVTGTWRGNREGLAANKQEGYPHDRRLSLWVHRGSEFAFESIRLRMLDGGTAERLRSGSAATSSTVPRTLHPVAELNALDEYNLSPWLSADGLTIYWQRGGGGIRSARRPDAESPFANFEDVFSGRHPTLSADEQILVYLDKVGNDDILLEARRSSRSANWTPGRPIEELRSQPNVKSPSLSADGLTLYFQRGPLGRVEIVKSSRPSRNAPWSQPNPIPGLSQQTFGPAVEQAPTWPRFDAEERTVWFTLGGAFDGKLMTSRRAAATEPFTVFEPIVVDGQPLEGRGPFYCLATNELFYSYSPQRDGRYFELWRIQEAEVPASLPAADNNEDPQISQALFAEPPPLEEWLKGRDVLTVSQDGTAMFTTIQDALNSQSDGQVVRVLDKGPYLESLNWRDKTDCGLISTGNTVIDASKWQPNRRGAPEKLLHRFEGLSDCRLHGFTFLVTPRDEHDRTPILFYDVLGQCVEHCQVVPTNSLPDGWKASVQIFSRELTTEFPQPMCVSDCLWSVPLHVINRTPKGVVKIARNWFHAPHVTDREGMELQISLPSSGAGTVICVERNIIERVREGSRSVRIVGSASAANILYEHNTLMAPRSSALEAEGKPNWDASIQDNLHLVQWNRCTFYNSATPFLPLARQRWTIARNYSPGPSVADGTSLPLGTAASTQAIRVLSPDPLNRNYMRVDPASITVPDGDPFPGALPPGPPPAEGDWFTRLQDRYRETLLVIERRNADQ